MLRSLFAPKPEKTAAGDLYRTIVEAARQPALYGEEGVADTLEGRFELIVLHTALVILVLRQSESRKSRAIAQSLFDVMFDDFDAAMRELGVGDSAVGKKIRFMAEGFYGRAQALDAALGTAGEDDELQLILARNLLAAEQTDARSERLSLYVNSAFKALCAQGADRLSAGEAPDFPAA